MDWLTGYTEQIKHKSPGTVDAYARIVRQFLEWLATKPGGADGFHPEQLTRTSISTYLKELEVSGISISHRIRVKSALSRLATWLIELGLITANPTAMIEIPSQALLAPRELTEDQRYIMKNLVEREGDIRSEAMFALGYWAGCRVSDVSWLKLNDTQLGPKIGSITVGFKNSKQRTIPILNEVRRPLLDYIQDEREKSSFKSSPFVFLSKRGGQLTDKGIAHWLRKIKSKARKDEWELIEPITFHDLRHDFSHRAREAGWPLEYLSVYLGHITKRGEPAIQTTTRYTAPKLDTLRNILKDIRG